MEKRFYSSESVTEGHPDKIADQVSDAILDAMLAKDPNSRVAVETFVFTGIVQVAGQVTTRAYIPIPDIVRGTIDGIGYQNAKHGFDFETCGVQISIDPQSPDIAMGVDEDSNHEQGAGDQGMMYGYASNETKELMPMPIALAHKLVLRLADVRKKGTLKYLRPDGKSQVTVEYDNGKPVRVDAVALAAQHDESVVDPKTDLMKDSAREELKRLVIEHAIPKHLLDRDTRFHINTTGKFMRGGPWADTGLTGRKIIVDTYGGIGRHGGGCFSGKDPSKVDRSGAYAARWVAKNIVASGAADKCEIQIAYAIGVARPVSIDVNTFGTGKVDDMAIIEAVRNLFDLRPKAIISNLKLKRPIYQKTAVGGHFGRSDKEFTWEYTDKAAALRKELGL